MAKPKNRPDVRLSTDELIDELARIDERSDVDDVASSGFIDEMTTRLVEIDADIEDKSQSLDESVDRSAGGLDLAAAEAGWDDLDSQIHPHYKQLRMIL